MSKTNFTSLATNAFAVLIMSMLLISCDQSEPPNLEYEVGKAIKQSAIDHGVHIVMIDGIEVIDFTNFYETLDDEFLNQVISSPELPSKRICDSASVSSQVITQIIKKAQDKVWEIEKASESMGDEYSIQILRFNSKYVFVNFLSPRVEGEEK